MNKQITIGLDVDDVLIEFNKHILSFVNERFNMNYKIENLTWDFNNLQPEHREEAHKLFSCREFFKTLELPSYSKLLIKQLQDLELNVVLITSVHPNVADLRYKMFEDLDVDYIYTKRKDLVKVDLLVEDSPTNALKAQSPVVILKQPWNKHLEEEGFEFIDNITELLDYVKVAATQEKGN